MNVIEKHLENLEEFKKQKELKIQQINLTADLRNIAFTIQLKDLEKRNKQIAKKQRTNSYIYTSNLEISRKLKINIRKYVKILLSCGALYKQGIGHYFKDKIKCIEAINQLYLYAYSRRQ